MTLVTARTLRPPPDRRQEVSHVEPTSTGTASLPPHHRPDGAHRHARRARRRPRPGDPAGRRRPAARRRTPDRCPRPTGRPSGRASSRPPRRWRGGSPSGRRPRPGSAPRCSRRPPGWRATAGCSRAVEQRIDAGAPAAVATVQAAAAVHGHVHRARRADGRAGHRRPRRPGPDRRRPDRAGRAGRPEPRRPVGAARRRPGAGRHRRAGPGAGDRPGHPAGRHDQPHRDHRPAARAALRRRGRRPRRRARGRDRAARRRAGHRHRGPRPADAEARVRAARVAAEELAGYAGPATTQRRARGAGARQRAGRRRARARRSRAHAEGVGLFRTELSFLGHAQEPTVEEQAAGYAEVLEAFVGRKVVLRTLDAGSDKPLAFATLPDEANPALGVRGLRIARRDPGHARPPARRRRRGRPAGPRRRRG